MSLLKKSLMSAMGIVSMLALSGAVHSSHKALLSNALSINALSINAVTTNALVCNGLTLNSNAAFGAEGSTQIVGAILP